MIILDSATPMLTELRTLSHGYAMDALSYASLKLRSAMVSKARSYGNRSYGAYFDDRRRLSSSKSGKADRSMYFSRFSHGDGSELHDMAEFLKYQVSDIYLHSRVGYIDFRGYNASLYRDGKKSSSKYVKGQGGVHAIGKFLEHGGRQNLTEKQKKFFRANGWGAAANRGYIQRVARPVVNPTFASMQGNIVGIIQKKYADALVSHMAKTSFRSRKIS